MRVLAGDIGGTTARLAIVDIDDTVSRVRHPRRFATKDFSGLVPIVQAFLAEVGDTPKDASFAIACPATDGACTGTNLGWHVDVRDLAKELDIRRTKVINDLRAVGYGLQRLGPADLVTLQGGEPDENGVMAIIGAGTGLGEAFVIRGDDSYSVHPSEGGHASFSASNEREWGLLRWLASTLDHVSYERVVSGPGLVSIYRYLAEAERVVEQPRVRRRMGRSDPAAVISGEALAGTDELSGRALEMFASAYGARAGDLALTVMATGGVYIAGGIAPRIVPKLREGAFMTAFRSKGRLSDVVSRIPINVILNPHVGLIGAAMVAMRG
jgi:glucokinase